MATLLGAIRAISAASRRYDREVERERKRLVKLNKEFAKMEALEQAELEVDTHENLLEVLLSMHTQEPESWDWKKILESSSLEEPELKHDNENQARSVLKNFEPTFFDRIFFLADGIKRDLKKKIEQARLIDRETYDSDLAQKAECDLALQILSGDLNAYMKAVKEINPFSDIAALGSGISIETEKPWYAEATLQVNGKNVIPSENKTLLKSGKLSVKKYPVSKFMDMYQDYVCSATIRIARELFGILPVETVFIHAMSDVLNTKTGHEDNVPVLSVVFPKKYFLNMNFDGIDCSDCVEGFVHNMGFKRSKGFSAIEKLDPEKFSRASS
ncbi:MAG: hypothetical protein COB53_03725 [Elusimicrobia bacterium]|nr:MAG: hypothetical protein COB53_03725 [Elusimicrobiota bacterium]